MRSKTKIDEINLVMEETKSAVHQNIDLIIQKGDKLDDLRDKSEALQNESFFFHKQARKIQHKMFYQKLKSYFFCLLLFLFILYIILSSYCGFNFHKC